MRTAPDSGPFERLLTLLEWMAGQPFERLVEGDPPLLAEVEAIVIGAHRDWYEGTGQSGWTEPKAYQWIRFEDPDPVARLADAARRLEPQLATRGTAVDAVIEMSRRRAKSYPDGAS